ncbi:MAG: 4-alpha-glucanotransferase [Erysipelotrichaceae bacterium]|nr:4-alpha-glucanotransferase [Erysipelotrichaceae bacterium]
MSINRSAGILLPIFSLPSNYGIGTLGKQAYKFVDFLVASKQTYWQVLPVGHTSYGDSPYSCFSSVAGNPYFIDLDLLIEDKLLTKKDVSSLKVKDDEHVDYGYIYKTRYPILYKAYKNGYKKYLKEFNKFVKDNSDWLIDYAMFMAIKKHFNMKALLEWDDKDIILRKDKAMKKYSELLVDDIKYYEFIQFLFFKQFYKLKKYANDSGIKIIGDLPIYVALDSCEVWADSKQFVLDQKTKVPKEVAGISPDYFSSEGQLWGNPLYNWKYMKKTGYAWWINRVKNVSKCFDVVRIDHFRGFETYWAVKYGEKTAKYGHWVNGPSKDFIKVLKEKCKDIDFIAEDLGIIDQDVTELLEYSGFPGMRVLQCAMADDGSSYHSPHNHIENCVCYVSTHDNEPIMGWIKNTKKQDLDYAKKYFGLNKEEGYNYCFIRTGMNSVAKLFMCQIQDYLGLDDKYTINRPGNIGSWTFRLKKNALNSSLSKKIASLTHCSHRDNN